MKHKTQKQPKPNIVHMYQQWQF